MKCLPSNAAAYLKIMFSVLVINMVVTNGKSQAKETAELFTLDQNEWRLVTDGVMGGVSEGELSVLTDGNIRCNSLKGQVRTDNNGGFIQIATDIEKPTARIASNYEGIFVKLKANGEDYNLHLRTSDLWFPWQAYRATFQSRNEWQVVKIPFASFVGYKTGEAFRVEKLKRIGIVAIGREFTADICVASVGFYKGQKSQ